MADTEYISKEAALACFSDWIDRYGHEHTADEMVEYQKIEELPEEDVRPVVRGKWIVHTSDRFPADSTIECDQCHAEQPAGIDDNFCPNCGADMREVPPCTS